MVDDALSQADAETLLRMPKKPATADAFRFPDLGGRIEVPLMSSDERERSSLDINRKRIALTLSNEFPADELSAEDLRGWVPCAARRFRTGFQEASGLS